VWAAVHVLLLPWLFYGLQSDDTDTFYHLAAGRFMAEHGGVLDREVSSFTIAGRPWTNYSWLFQRLLYAAFRVAGLPGVLAVRSVFLLAAVNLVFVLVWRRSRASPLATFVLVLTAAGLVSARALQVRPHLASYVCLAALLVVLDVRTSRGLVSAAAVFGICAAWANLHGIGYPVGLSVLAVAAIAAWAPPPGHAPVARPERLRAGGLLMAGAGGFLANPFGWRLFATPAVALDAEAMSQIGEMGRLPLAALATFTASFELRAVALANLVVLAALALVPTWVRHRAWAALGHAALGAGLLLFRGRRMVPELAILAVPAIAQGLAVLSVAGRSGRRRLLQGLGAYLLAAAVVTTWRDARSGLFEPLSDRLPHGPVALLRRLDFEGHVLADATHSGFVSWELPRARTFFDMRMPEPFSAHEVWLYKAIGETVSLDQVRRRYGVDAVLVPIASPRARGLLADEDGTFAVAYADHAWALFLPASVLAARPGLRVSFLREMEAIADGGGLDPAVDRDALSREVDRLLGVWPGNHLAWRTWLWLRTQDGRAAAAAPVARTLADRYPRLPVYPFAEGLAWSAAGEKERAAQAFERALRVDPTFEPASAALARALAGMGHNARALEVLEELHERRRYRLDLDDTALLAALRHRQGRLEAAADAYGRALWLTPDGDVRREPLERSLGEVCRQLGPGPRRPSACTPAGR
jgi:tetratricopeptide (TPR) repeat protein